MKAITQFTYLFILLAVKQLDSEVVSLKNDTLMLTMPENCFIETTYNFFNLTDQEKSILVRTQDKFYAIQPIITETNNKLEINFEIPNFKEDQLKTIMRQTGMGYFVIILSMEDGTIKISIDPLKVSVAHYLNVRPQSLHDDLSIDETQIPFFSVCANKIHEKALPFIACLDSINVCHKNNLIKITISK